MEPDVIVKILVTRAAADLLGDEARARTVGAMVSDWALSFDARIERLMTLMAEIKGDRRAARGI